MNECDKQRLKFEKALYDELSISEKEELNAHLTVCVDCSKEFAELKETLVLVQSCKREEPREEFMNNFWNELNPKLQRGSALKSMLNKVNSVFSFEPRTIRRAAAGFAILISGILIGRFFFNGNGAEVTPSFTNQNQQNQIAVHARAERYIDRSKVLLMGLMNFDPASDDFETISMSHQQKISNELLSEAADLKKDLNNPTNRQLKELISDIEIILMQIANLEMQNDLEGVDLIKAGVDKRGIFLKINIQEIKKSSHEINPASAKSDKKENNT